MKLHTVQQLMKIRYLQYLTQNENNVIQEHDKDKTFCWTDVSTKLFISIYTKK